MIVNLCTIVTRTRGVVSYEPDEGNGRGMFGNATMNFVRKLKEEYMNLSKTNKLG